MGQGLFLVKIWRSHSDASSIKFQKPTLGQNVRIKIRDIDRAKMDPRSIIAVITDIKDEEFYELGTKLGKLKALYTRNQFISSKENFLSNEVVGTEEISVREVERKLSFVGGQGFRKCNCSKRCTTKMCLCKSANLLCNSTVNLAVTSDFNYDLIMLKEILINKIHLLYEHSFNTLIECNKI
jgi:hypothetical protein